MLLRFRRSRAYERFQQTARIVVCPSSSGFAFAFRLLFPYGLSVMSRLIGKSLSDDTHKCALSALDVIYAEPNAVAIAKIEFTQIAVQMALATMLVNAFHAALENAVVAFDGVGVDNAATVFMRRMVNAFMACKLAADCFVMAPFVGHQVRFLADIISHDTLNIGAAGAINMEAAGRAATLNKGQYDILVSGSAFLFWNAFNAADASFGNFHNSACASHRRNADGPHSLANAMRHEPCSLESYAKGPVKLVA